MNKRIVTLSRCLFLSGIFSLTFSLPVFAAGVTTGMNLQAATVNSGHQECISGCDVETSRGNLTNVQFKETTAILVIRADVQNLKINDRSSVQYPDLHSVVITLKISSWQKAVETGTVNDPGLSVPVDALGKVLMTMKDGETQTADLDCSLYAEGLAKIDFNEADRAIDCSVNPQGSNQDLPDFTFTFSK